MVKILQQKDVDAIFSEENKEYRVIAEEISVVNEKDLSAFCVLESDQKYFLASYKVIKEEVFVNNVLLEVEKIC